MRKRLSYGLAIVLLVLSTMLVVWQGSFHQKDFIPSNPAQTLILWAVSTLIFILMVTVGWILARDFTKLYVAHQAKKPGSRIRTKLVIGALLLSCVPVFFLALWSYEVLNLNLIAFSRALGNVNGQIFAIFVITDAVAEAAVGLGILIALFRNKETVLADEIDILKW